MSDYDDFESEEEESGKDFSASEDEWKPENDEDSSEEEVEDDEDETTENTAESDDERPKGRFKGKSNGKMKGRVGMKKMSKAPKLTSSHRQSSTLRSRLGQRINPKLTKPTGSPVPVKVANLLSTAKFVKPKQISSEQSSIDDEKQRSTRDADDSDSASSSGDEAFVRPSDIDLSSDIFNMPTSKASTSEAPVFDCNAGMKLSDSSDDDEELLNIDDMKKNEAIASTSKCVRNSLIGRINEKSSGEVHDFTNLQEFAKNLESAKAQLQKLKEKENIKANSNGASDETDVAALLSLGEKTINTKSNATNRKRKHKIEQLQASDDSEWENVSDDNEHHRSDDIKDIQITVGGGSTVQRMSREEKKMIDIEATIKRRLNRDIKEKQTYLHKVSVLGWIAHGNYINRILNDMRLMEMCLKLLPSKNAYPDGDTDIMYFKAITDWFHGLFKLKSRHLYCDLKGLRSKILSLQLQLRSKQVICKCDYVLLFVSMLRSIGIQCRLVINMAVLPLRPPQKDLFVISTSKSKDETGNDETIVKEAKEKDKVKSKAASTLAKKVKVSAEKMKTSFVEKEKEKKDKAKDSKKSKKSPEEEPSTSKSALGHSSRSKLIRQEKIRDTGSPVPINKITINKVDVHNSSHSKSNHKHREESKSPSKNGRDKDKEKPKASSSSRSHPKESSSSPTKSQNKDPVPSLVKQEKPGSSKAKVDKNANESETTASKLKKVVASSRAPKETGAAVAMFSPRKTRRQAAELKLKLPQLDGASDMPKKPKKGAKRTAAANAKKSQKDESLESNSDSDFEASPPKRLRSKLHNVSAKSVKQRKSVSGKSAANTSKKIDRRVFSDEEDENNDQDQNTERMDFWVEAYAEKEKKWIVIDPIKKKVDCVDHVRKFATKPIIYVFAWNNDNTLRDVTPRYCSQFHTTTRKQRAEQMWIDEAIRSFVEQRNSRTIIEDVEFSKLHMDTPMPKSISEYKNHPLYALERHLLKFEAIYPRNALILGYIRNEPVYARECVHTLHSREIWVKQARTVKVGEQPYKIVKARPKWIRVMGQWEMEEPKPLEIFGFWQTEPYKPPVAENGIVPRNPYGNVELFKPEMLPIGTRHIQLPNLNRICKKMGIDCAQAVVGFDFHSGSSHPTFDGFVVCEEFADAVIKQWELDQEEQIRKETEKREARIYGNWKKLIKGLLIRERLKRKFNFGVDTEKSTKKKTHKE